VANATRGLDLEKAGLDLSALTGQSGAGQDLINALLRNMPQEALPGGPPSLGARNTLASGGPRGVGFGFDRNPLARGSGGFADFFNNRPGLGAGLTGGIEGTSVNRDSERLNQQNLNRFQSLADIFGQGPGGAVAQQGVQAGASLLR